MRAGPHAPVAHVFGGGQPQVDRAILRREGGRQHDAVELVAPPVGVVHAHTRKQARLAWPKAGQRCGERVAGREAGADEQLLVAALRHAARAEQRRPGAPLAVERAQAQVRQGGEERGVLRGDDVAALQVLLHAGVLVRVRAAHALQAQLARVLRV